MNKAYVAFTKTTAVYPNVGSNPFYPVLGLFGETAELVDKMLYKDTTEEIRKEAGDVCWYLARTGEEFGLDIVKIWNKAMTLTMEVTPSVCSNWLIMCGELAELAKKDMRGDDKREQRLQRIETALGNIISYLKGAAAFYQFNIPAILDENMAKLAKRKEEGTLKGSGDNR